jgi:dTMP kinase
MQRGPFISLEGIDGAGKSTQCRLLADFLRARGYEVIACRDPGGTEVGNILRELLLGHRGNLSLPCEAFLFLASRAQLTVEVIRPALEAGKAVIADRFTLSNVVYQGHAGGLDPQELWTAGRLATSGLEPDLTLVLDLPVAEAQARRQRPADRMESRGQEFHERVRAGFLTEARRRPEHIRIVDAAGSPESIQQRIRELVAAELKKT